MKACLCIRWGPNDHSRLWKLLFHNQTSKIVRVIVKLRTWWVKVRYFAALCNLDPGPGLENLDPGGGLEKILANRGMTLAPQTFFTIARVVTLALGSWWVSKRWRSWACVSSGPRSQPEGFPWKGFSALRERQDDEDDDRDDDKDDGEDDDRDDDEDDDEDDDSDVALRRWHSTGPFFENPFNSSLHEPSSFFSLKMFPMTSFFECFWTEDWSTKGEWEFDWGGQQHVFKTVETGKKCCCCFVSTKKSSKIRVSAKWTSVSAQVVFSKCFWRPKIVCKMFLTANICVLPRSCLRPLTAIYLAGKLQRHELKSQNGRQRVVLCTGDTRNYFSQTLNRPSLL